MNAQSQNTKDQKSHPRFNEQGLVPAIAQDMCTGKVLMLAWMNEQAWQLTQETGEAHFWSRSRNSLWRKGETSGNLLKVIEIILDCDADTVLLKVEAQGPACHTGEYSCFFNPVQKSTVSNDYSDLSSILCELYKTIGRRKGASSSESYTARLFSEGMERISKKVGEEAAEVIVAALAQTDERVISESADLLYHLLVLLSAREIPLGLIARELERRHR